MIAGLDRRPPSLASFGGTKCAPLVALRFDSPDDNRWGAKAKPPVFLRFPPAALLMVAYR